MGYPKGNRELNRDALTSDRPYRKAWSKRKALDFIKKESGTHFDPKVVEAFLKMIWEKNLTS